MYDSESENDVDEYEAGRDAMLQRLIEQLNVQGADADDDAPRLAEVPEGAILDVGIKRVMEFHTLLLRSRLNNIEYRSACPLFGRAPNDSFSPSLPFYWL